MLSSYRVLDLTDDRGHFAGLLFAQLGADVIAIEPPGGQRSRHLAPFAGNSPDPIALGVTRADENLVYAAMCPWLQVLLVPGVTENRSIGWSYNQSRGVAYEAREIPDIDLMLDENTRETRLSEFRAKAIKPRPTSQQLVLAQFHGCDISHGAESIAIL